jgi:hypothetical protein
VTSRCGDDWEVTLIVDIREVHSGSGARTGGRCAAYFMIRTAAVAEIPRRSRVVSSAVLGPAAGGA